MSFPKKDKKKENDPKAKNNNSPQLSRPASLVGPQSISTGSLIENERNARLHGYVPRFCSIKIKRIVLVKAFKELSSSTTFSIDISFEEPKSKKLLKSGILNTSWLDSKLDLDVQFGFSYMHKIKPPYDRLKIVLSEGQKKSKEYPVIGYAILNMNSILQSPLDEVLSAYPPKPKKLEKEQRKVERKKEKEQKKEAKNQKKAYKKKPSEGDIAPQLSKKLSNSSHPEEDFQQQEDMYSKTISPMGTGFHGNFKPILDMYISATSYPIQVDSLQLAKEWDDAFFPETLESMDATSFDFSDSDSNFFSTSEKSDSSEEDRNERNRTLSITDPTDITPPVNRGPLLSDLFRSQFGDLVPTTGSHSHHQRLGLDKAKKLKDLITRSSSSKKKENIVEDKVERISFGASSSEAESGSIRDEPDQLVFDQEMESSFELEDLSRVILIQSSKKKSRNFEQCIKNSIYSKSICASNDISQIFPLLESHASSSQTLPKIIICGGDSFINSVLRGYVDYVHKALRTNITPQFFLVPIGGKNDMASQIALTDPGYKTNFFEGPWSNILEKEDELNQSEMKEIFKKFQTYIDEATNQYHFPIGEAQLTIAGEKSNSPSVQKSIPFIKGIQIVSKDMDSEMILDYWTPKKKGENHKSVKNFEYITVKHLAAPSAPSSTSSEAPTLSLAINAIKEKKTVKELLKLQKKPDIVPPEITHQNITRLVCSVDSKQGMNQNFKALIDGIEWSGIKYVSINPQFNSRIKTLSIQIFKSK